MYRRIVHVDERYRVVRAVDTGETISLSSEMPRFSTCSCSAQRLWTTKFDRRRRSCTGCGPSHQCRTKPREEQRVRWRREMSKSIVATLPARCSCEHLGSPCPKNHRTLKNQLSNLYEHIKNRMPYCETERGGESRP